MKLELKHLAPYLPYGLTFQDKETKSEFEFIGMRMDNLIYLYNEDFCGKRDNPLTTGIGNINYGSFKPILRPLSELFISESKFGAYNWEYPDEFKGEVELGIASYDDMQELLSNNVDVFGLIEKGLAIDINTL